MIAKSCLVLDADAFLHRHALSSEARFGRHDSQGGR